MAPAELSDDEKLNWIRLIRSEAIGPATFHELISHFGTAGAALDALPELGKRGGLRGARQICSLEDAEREWDAAMQLGAKILALPEPGYPPLLRHIPAPPPLIFARGNPALAAQRTIAIVGSRNASAIGRQLAGNFAEEFGRAEISVASGLARGIDTAAHRASLASGTIAVIAGGIDMIYPPENAALHEAIAERGLLICENPPGFAPRGQDFPRRNRIISGVSSGVVVVEAARKSGSLISARLAAEQGRDVFAVPGHPLDPRAAGTNALIKNGAHIATSADEIIAELFSTYSQSATGRGAGFANAPASYTMPDYPPEPDQNAHKTVLDALSFTPVHPDVLLRQTGMNPRTLTIALLELDIAGQIERHQNECVSLRPDFMAGAEAGV